MRIRHAAAATALALATPLLLACSAPDPELVEALEQSTAPSLFVPELDGEGPVSFLANTVDHSVTLRYGDGFTPTLTLRKAPAGDLCAGRAPDWDRCRAVDEDAVRLSFEEMDAVVVRRDGTELFWNNISFELPDEDYATDEELLAAIEAKVDEFVQAAREAEALTPEEFASEVPDGKVGQP